jgi:hypothetical protein
MPIVVARRRPARPFPEHAIIASCRERDLSRRVTARLGCRCGYLARGDVAEVAQKMAAHLAEATGVAVFRR